MEEKKWQPRPQKHAGFTPQEKFGEIIRGFDRELVDVTRTGGLVGEEEK